MHKIISGLLAASFVLAPVSAAFAASPLSVTCAGTPTTTSVSWTSQVTGGVSPFTYLWGTGATSSVLTLAASAGTSTMTLQVIDASSTVATTSCTTVVPAPTTVPVKRVQALHIEDNGQFQAKAMVVKTVGTGSFTAEVFGITYTVKSTQTVTVGNHVDVSGRIDDATPLTVDARRVKERPATKVVKHKISDFFKKERKQEDRDDHGRGKGRGGHDD